MSLTNKIVIEKAKEFGFDFIGFAEVKKLSSEIDNLSKWLTLGYHATMDYMNRNFEKRKNVKEILPNAKSVISLAMNYYTNHQHVDEKNRGKISRYAWGKDYHLVIWEKLEILEEELKKVDQQFDCISYVDTGPVMDKAWAVRGGIGWLGKNSNVITREMGSWIFLATIITNQDFEYNDIVADHCGTCRACIDACPTNAIIQEYVVDSNKCISYLTIENKGEIGKEFKSKFDNWLFGCDVCQDVCPWNKKFSVVTNEKEFEPKYGTEFQINEIRTMTEEDFKRRFETSPIKRTKLSGLKRNAEFLM